VIAHVDRATAILFPKNAAVGGHEHGNRIRRQQNLSGSVACQVVNVPAAHARILEIHGLHELVESHMGVEAGGPNHCWKRHSQERGQRLATEAGETQIEPYDIRLNMPDGSQQPYRIAQAVERPASNDGLARQLLLIGSNVIAQNDQRQSFGMPQLARDMKPVLIQRVPAGRKCGHQTDLHCCPGLKIACRDSFPRREKY
jgi:hypothetical protein